MILATMWNISGTLLLIFHVTTHKDSFHLFSLTPTFCFVDGLWYQQLLMNN